MENQNKEIFLPRKVFLEKTKILDLNLRDYLNSCGLRQSLELFSPNQLKLISSFIQKCVSSEIILTFDDTDFINNQKIENKESLESKIKKTTSKHKQPIIKQESSKQVNGKQKTTILLKDHQIEAKNCILQEIEQNSRCQFISACGTGKTIVSQRTVEEYIEKFNTSITLILVPSLELLSQFHKSWENNSNFKEHYKNDFLLCSKDEIKRINKQNFQDIKLLKKLHVELDEVSVYLEREINHKLIFSTYQSLPLLASALLENNLSITLAVFDEAHRTTGKWNSLFSYGLYDENIKIDKRLFMTATPKIDVESIYDIVSMDNEQLYGKIAYNLNIGDAINKGIIKDYKIIVTKISAEIKNEHDYYSILSECILKVMNEKKLKKALLFNSTIKDSEKIKNYVNYKKEISENDFEAFHVDGYLDIKTRKEIIYKLSNEDEKTIVTNAKLFSEGIDIPAIELIGFLNRTKSIVDIAQRVGRVQRKRFEDDNEPGYIFIPLFEDKNSNISDYYSGDWDYLVDVMLAFKEMDNRVNASFYNMFSNNDSKQFLKQIEIVDFNKNNTIETKNIEILQEHIISKLKHEIIAIKSEKWDINFHNYKQFLIDNKRMPKVTKKNKEETVLAKWVQGQIKKKNKNEMLHDRIEKLNTLIKLGFCWDKFDFQWNEKFNEFKEFYLLNQKEPQSYKKTKLSKDEKKESLIAKWLGHQKANFQDKKLLKERYELLLPFIKNWENKTEVLWKEQFQKYKDFMKNNNNKFPMDNKKERGVYVWITNQKKKYFAKELDEQKCALLNEISDEWILDGKERLWKDQNLKLLKFITDNNRLPVYSNNSLKKDPDEHNVYLWYYKQQKAIDKNTLKDWQKDLFDKTIAALER
ncbi:DEAD/DEAH box helicase family protein [Aliarcobacter butzleri]|uniref:DEAD/DEAH box helicase family protein n=1 Tax=Aliarcobacter butzleri TaxID=28197 RepID=UPI0021B24421|nr:DEAD/DEAH box helicase family protein [Aliarcobacter butzleri]MCT7647661.1 DEAD/DEAH box helicase family protein [Aliarcobacter butzleri]